MSEKKVYPDTNFSAAQSALRGNSGKVGVGARYITTTLPYVNADPHVGFALEVVQADVLARYYRLLGDDVFFNTGTDEHGQKIAKAADEAGRDRQEYVDHFAGEFNKLKEALDLSYDNFIRTSDEAHMAAAQELWMRCQKKGDIYKKKYQGLYCVGCEVFLRESDLVDGKCPLHPNLDPQEVEEENYFFALSKYQDQLREYLQQPNTLVPEWRRAEALHIVDELEDISISREKKRFDWGVPVPGDDEQVMYVWFDALTNYISTLGWPNDPEGNFKKFWDEGVILQVAGKDQIRFQSIIWQGMLFSADIKPTDQIVYHGFITSEGKKMSKSVGNTISPYEMVERYGTDATRYILLRHVHPFDDSDLTWERMDEWYTANLVNGLGNLTARIMKMAESYGVSYEGEWYQEYVGSETLSSFEFHEALNNIWRDIQLADEYIQKTEPFKKIKINEEEAEKDVQELLHRLLGIGGRLEPFMPQTSKIILNALKANKKPENLFNRLEEK